jgi:arylsulfatase A-like enzyme
MLLALACAGCGTVDTSDPPSEPVAAPVRNVVWIIVDDLGWRDIGVAGSTFYETPHIDRLAAAGMRFTQFDTASGVCSPTRASFMTGKHPARVDITNWIGGRQDGMLLQADYERQLPLDEITPGEAFLEAGYATAYMGKWHLGRDREYHPDVQGFETTVAVNGAGSPASYFYPYRRDEPSANNVPDLEDGGEGKYLTDRLTDEAIKFLRAHAGEPFLLVLSHYAVHTPIESKDELTARYEEKAAALPPNPEPFTPEGEDATSKTRQDRPDYAGMIASTDESVGRILDALEDLGIADDTAVVLVSDNGGLSTLYSRYTSAPTSTMPLRAGKGWLYEGGIRAPLIIKWPGVTDRLGPSTGGSEERAGGAMSDEPTTSMDLYPTLLEMAGLPSRPEQHVDGLSLVPLMQGADELEREALFWHFPHYHGSGNRPSGALRLGNLKLVEWFEDGRTELYDLSVDPYERNNIAASDPDEVIRLKDLLEHWRISVGANMPTPNPEWEGR